MKKLVAMTVAVLAVAIAAVGIAEEVLKSGLGIGEHAGAFNVKDCSGPAEGKSLCYRCRYSGRPTVSIFARKLDDNLTALIKDLDAVVGKNQDKKMAAFVVLLSDKPDEHEKALKELATKNGIKNVPLTLMEGQVGPPDYKIAKDAEVTVLMWNKLEVKSNTAVAKGKLDKKVAEAIIKDTSKILN
jgi:hypothetical protein